MKTSNAEINILRLMSESGAMVSVVVMGLDGLPIRDFELAQALREYADILEDPDLEEVPN